MTRKLLRAFFEGFKGSFKLSAGIVLAICSVIGAFAHHTLSLRTMRQGRAYCGPPITMSGGDQGHGNHQDRQMHA